MKHFKFFLSFLVALTTGASSVWAAVGDTFTATTPEGVPVTYKVLTEDGTTGTVQVNRGQNSNAIPSDAVSVIIPVTVTNDGVTYTVTEIGDEAFYGNAVLGSIAFAENSQVKKIGNNSFSYCTNLQSIVLPDCVESIGQNVIAYSSVTSINIPASVQTIDAYTFMYASSLQTVVFPENSQLKTIGELAFSNCTNLLSLSFPEGLQTIGQGAFGWCTSMEEVTIPSTVTSIGGKAFLYQNSNYEFKCFLKKVTCLATTPPSLPTTDGYTAFKGKYSDDVELIIPQESISAYRSSWESGFKPCISFTVDGLKYKTTDWYWVQLGDGEQAAVDTEATEVTIPVSVIYNDAEFYINLGKNAFMGCTALTQLIMEAQYAPDFIYCDNGGDDVFDTAMKTNCTLVLPLDNEGYDSWEQYFKEVYVPGDTPIKLDKKFTATNDQGVDVTYRITSLEPYEVETYGYWMDDHAVTAIPSDYQGPLTIPETVTFEGVTFTVTTIGEGSFYADNLDLGLTEVTLPSTITAIGNYAFAYCSSITKMNVSAFAPPQLGNNSLSLAEDAVLYVPEESVVSYQNSDWAEYFGGGILMSTPFVAEVGKKFSVPSNEGVRVTYQITSLDAENHTGTVQLYGWYGGPYIENGYDKHKYINAINNVEIDYQLTIPSTLTVGSGDNEFTYTVTAVGDYAFLFMQKASCILPYDGDWSFSDCVRIYLPSTITRIGKNAFSAMGGYGTDVLYAVLPEGVEEIDDFAFEGAFFLKFLLLPKSLKRIGRSAFEDCEQLEEVAVFNPIPIEPEVWLQYEVDPLRRFAFNKRPQNNPTLYVPYGSKKKYLNSGSWGFDKLSDGTYNGVFFKYIEMMDNKEDDVATIEPDDEYSTDFAEEMVDGGEVLDLEDAVAGGVYYNLKEDYENGFDDVEGCIVINNSSDMSGVSGNFDRAFLVENEYSGLVVEVKGKGIVMIDCKTLGSGKLTVRIGDGSPTAYSQDEKGAISINFDVTNPTPIYIYATGIGEQSANATRMNAPRRSISAGDNCVKIYSLSVVPTIVFSISNVGMGTFACNSALDFTDLEDVAKVYYATYDRETSTLTFHQIYKVPAHTGVLLVSTDGGAVSNQEVPGLFEGEADEVWDNVFVQGTGEAVSYSEDEHIYNYILYNGDAGLGFYKANKNPIATNRAYIHIPFFVPVAPTANYFTINLETDGITTATNGQLKVADGKIYNIAGQRLSTLQRGINIVNGKKVFVK